MDNIHTLKYKAFISYSHIDGRSAKWLHKSLESYKVDKDLVGRETKTGLVPAKLRPVFRDRDEFTAGESLKDQTLLALNLSRALIVICSPAAAKSHYVNEEVRLFKQHHAARPVIPVIIAGTPGDGEYECFPAAVRFDVSEQGLITNRPAELLAADIRESADGKALALAKVVATLLGLGTDDIYRRAERERARRQRRWIAGLSLVAVSLAGLAGWAEINRREAQRNFSLAKQGADALVVDIARGLRDIEGMRSQTVRKILGRADTVISKLVENSDNNLELLRSKAAMLNEFVETYIAVGDTDAAADAAKEGLIVAKHISGAAHFDVSMQRALGFSFVKVGDALIEVGKFKAAKQNYGDSLTFRRKLATQHPDNLRVQRDVSVSLNRLGELEEIRAHYPKALAYFREGLTIRKQLVAKNPKWRRDLIVSHIKLGDIYLAQKDFEAGKLSFDKALVVARDLAKLKDNTKHQRDLAIVYQRMGNLGIAAKDAQIAEGSYQGSLETFERLAKLDPGNVAWKRDIAVSFMKLGDTARLAGNKLRAASKYSQSIAVLRSLLRTDANNVQWSTDLAEALMLKAETSTLLQRHKAAQESLEVLARLEQQKKFGEEQERWRKKLKLLVAR